MKLGLDRKALHGALQERLSPIADGITGEEQATLLAETITEVVDLNNRAVQRQLEEAGLRFRN